MILFSIHKKNNEVTLFRQKCGAPVKRKGVESFKLFIPTNKIVSNDTNFINDYLEFLKSCYVWCEYKGIESLDLSEKELQKIKDKYKEKNIDFTYEFSDNKNLNSKDYHVFYFDIEKNYEIFGLDKSLIETRINNYNLYLLTCVRYLQKDHGFNIPEIALKLSKNFTKWQKIKCLQLAHYPFNKNYDSFYSLLFTHYFSIPITNKELVERLIVRNLQINDTFGLKKANLYKFTKIELKQIFDIYNNLNLSNLNNYLLLKRKLENLKSDKILNDSLGNYDYFEELESVNIFKKTQK